MCNAHSYSDLKMVKTLFNVTLKGTGRNRCHYHSRHRRRQNKQKLLSQLHNNCKTILLSYYSLSYATYLVVVHYNSSKFNLLCNNIGNNNKSKF